MTIPSDILKALNLGVGAQVDVSVDTNGFVVRLVDKPRRKRYSLGELLRGVTPETMRLLRDETACAHEGSAVGREL